MPEPQVVKCSILQSVDIEANRESDSVGPFHLRYGVATNVPVIKPAGTGTADPIYWRNRAIYSQRRERAASSRLTRRIGTYADMIVTTKKNRTTDAYIHREPCTATFERERMMLLVAS